MNHITSHCAWSEIPMALSFYALAVLRITEHKCPAIHYMALERSKISGLKISLLLFNLKRKLVLGHCLSPVAVVPLLHGVRERWNTSHGRSNPEPASIRQHPCPVFNLLPLPHPLWWMTMALRTKFKLLHSLALILSSPLGHLLSAYLLGILNFSPFPGPAPVQIPLCRKSPLQTLTQCSHGVNPW